ncbi:MAG: hypothetical protein FWE03_01895 [Firmicutes bacterium]|nr:hypothetical protein [Bacillota bacterium]
MRQNNNIANKNFKIKAAIIIAAVCAMFIISLYFIAPSLTFWPGNGEFNQIIRIGVWDTDDDNQGLVTNFDDAYFIIRQADPFMQLGINRIHILGDANYQTAPNIPSALIQNDVLLFKYGTSIFAVQIIGTLPLATFTSWENLMTAINNPLNPTHTNPNLTDHNLFRPGNVYTRFHAPVSHNNSQFLARHDSVTSVPQMGTDWFLVNPSWLPQNYPLGAIVEHNGNHFKKIRNTIDSIQIVAPLNTTYWQSLTSIDINVESAPNFNTQASWNLHDVVEYQNIYFASVANNNSSNPITSPLWQQINEFDRQNLVPWYGSQPHLVGDLVRHTLADGEIAFFRRDNTGGTSLITSPYGQWRRVHNWHGLTGVPYWSPSIHYSGTAFLGALVNYAGAIFQLSGTWSPLGQTPVQAFDHWRRVRTWEETQRPIEFTRSSWSRNTIFKVTTGDTHFYSVLIHGDITSGNSVTPSTPYSGQPIGTNNWFRRVSEWTPVITFSSIYTTATWSTATINMAYTIDIDTGEKIFWESLSSQTANHPFDGSPFWRRHSFPVRDTIIVSFIMGNSIIWDRNTLVNPVTNLNPLPPSVANNHWTRRVLGVSNPYVYTIEDGVVALWRNNLPIPTGGNINSIGGSGWIRINFTSTQHFVYTINAVDLKQFWFSPNRSSLNPSVGSGDWVLIHDAIEIPNVGVDGIIIYPTNGRGFYYFHVLDDGTWNKLSNAWIGNFGHMINHWGNLNRYQSGDIVVYGVTAVGKFRFFRMRNGINTSLAVGVSPMSESGQTFWEAVR